MSHSVTDSTVLLGHGSGGQMMKRIIDEVFLDAFGSPELLEGNDAGVAALPASGRIAMSTDSFVVTPQFFPGGNIGRLAVCGTVNDVATSGANVRYLSCGFILEEGYPMDKLRQIVQTMADTAHEAGVAIITGDTKVVERGGADGVYINTAGVGEVPVGAVVARNGEIIAAAHNTRETEKNALHHAELLAIDAACKKLGGWRLWQCELFVTLEPCPMCSGGIINSRIRRVVYGAADTKAGCCGSVTDLFALPFNHHPVVESGLRAEEAQALLQAFFLRLREQRAAKPRWKPPVTP